jgi:predicted dehydrogenase
MDITKKDFQSAVLDSPVPVQWVSGHTQRLYSEEVEDAAHGVFNFASGLKASIDTSWSERHHRTLTMNISLQAENGTLEFNEDEVKVYLDSPAQGLPEGWSTWKKPDLFQGVSIDVGGPHYTRQAEAFVESIRNNKPVHNDARAAGSRELFIRYYHQ